ncbi:MAG TPA: alpha-mannosidase, partial [bacterium]|nr:alpha-mannosidase [bacterium]
MTDKKRKKGIIHLVCNAHLDPIWLWEWEEGAAEAISTFRTAADFCDEYNGFVFNHNEVVLYKWVAEYEPTLFKRIQKLVKQGKWHIIGGWYVQPDCNMPSGESFARQGLVGKRYFKKHFGVDVKTAINFDPFGHTRGLAQILKKSGFDAYLFCRPGQNDCPLPDDDFVWAGYDGTEILAHRSSLFYGNNLGGARSKVEAWLKQNPEKPIGMVLWGVGDHGGGASRLDLAQLNALIDETPDWEIRHSNPDVYFAELAKKQHLLPRHGKDINPWAVGCYTSIIRIKQKHRLLENELYAVEKMAANAWMQGLMEYPQDDLNQALEDLLLCEFHDVLPGSCIQPAEEAAIRILDHGLEILARLKARAFFALSSGQPKPPDGQIPVFVYNPHPYKVKQMVECEFQLADQNWADSFTQITVHQKGKTIPSQVEREVSNIPLDWRKRVAFHAELEPSQMNRFDCILQVVPKKPETALRIRNGKVHFRTDELDVLINAKTGLMDRFRVNGTDFLRKNAFQPLVIKDDVDPWGMCVKGYRNVEGAFTLMDAKEGAWFSGLERLKGIFDHE